MLKKTLFSLTAIAVVVSIYLIFFIAPVPIDPMEAGGDPINFKIFYFHVPIAVTAYLAFAVDLFPVFCISEQRRKNGMPEQFLHQR